MKRRKRRVIMSKQKGPFHVTVLEMLKRCEKEAAALAKQKPKNNGGKKRAILCQDFLAMKGEWSARFMQLVELLAVTTIPDNRAALYAVLVDLRRCRALLNEKERARLDAVIDGFSLESCVEPMAE